MDLSDIEAARRDDTAAHGSGPETAVWQGFIAALGAEIASPLTVALERINALTTTGRIDRRGLRALREEVEQARRIGMASQQIARLASGRVRQSHERIDLAQTLAGVLAHRAREIHARGVSIAMPPLARPVAILIDASLLFGLLETMLDWALACARSNIALHIGVKAWPAHARLSCRFAHRPVDQLDDGAPTADEVSRLDSVHWRLLQQTALTLGVASERSVDAAGTLLTLEFPRTVNQTMDGVTMVELDDGFPSSLDSKPLAGSHILVVAQDRELRVQLRDAMRNMGLLIDCVDSVAQAEDFCRDGLPHALIIDAALCDERFAALRRGIGAEVAHFAFIEVAADGAAPGHDAGEGMRRIARRSIAQTLAAALLFELSRLD